MLSYLSGQFSITSEANTSGEGCTVFVEIQLTCDKKLLRHKRIYYLEIEILLAVFCIYITKLRQSVYLLSFVKLFSLK